MVVKGFEGGDMVEKEKRRQEVLQRRQARELEMRAAFEAQRQAIQQANERKLKQEAERQAIALKDKMLREKEWNAHIRQKELERAAEQTKQEELSRQVRRGGGRGGSERWGYTSRSCSRVRVTKQESRQVRRARLGVECGTRAGHPLPLPPAGGSRGPPLPFSHPPPSTNYCPSGLNWVN